MPTQTFSIAASLDDQEVSNSIPAGTPTRITGGTSIEVFRDNDLCRNGLLRWDTSSIPDGDTVTAATLRLNVLGTLDAHGFSLVGEFYAWTGSSDSDQSNTAPASPILSKAISTIGAGSVDFTITDLSGVSKTGTTSVRLHISGSAPNSSNNSVAFYAFDHASNPEPQLIVTYEPEAADMVGGVGS